MSCSDHLGQSGSAKSSGKVEYGVTTACAQAMVPRLQPGSASTYSFTAYFTRRTCSTGSILCWRPAVALPPLVTVVVHGTALDLDHDDPHVGEQDDEVGLVVEVLVDQHDVREQQHVARQGVTKSLPDLCLGRGCELR